MVVRFSDNNIVWSCGNPGLSVSTGRGPRGLKLPPSSNMTRERTHDTNNRNVGFYINNLTNCPVLHLDYFYLI